MQVNIGIYRSNKDKWIRGVCGGLGEKFGVNSLLVRLGFVVAALIVPGATLVTVIALYVVLGLLLPERGAF